MIKLPKPYISYSQYRTAKLSIGSYAKKYFEGGDKGFETKELRFGKEFAEARETGDQWGLSEEEKAAHNMPCFPFKEFELRSELELGEDKIELFSKLDSCKEDLSAFTDDKTGKAEWTQQLVDENEQLLFYALSIYLKTGKIPEYAMLCWAETEDGEDKKSVHFTGKTEVFRKDFTMSEIRQFKDDLIKVIMKISEEYEKFLSGNKDKVNMSIISQFEEAETQARKWKEKSDMLKEEVEKELKAQGLEGLGLETFSGKFFFTTRKKYEYSEEFLKEKELLDIAKRNEEKTAPFTETVSLTYKAK